MEKCLWVFVSFLVSSQMTNGQICTNTLQVLTIKDTDVEVQILSTTRSSDITSMTVSVSNNVDKDTALSYFTYSTDDNNFILSTTESFANVNKDASPTNNKALDIYLTIVCSSGQTYLQISIENTHQNSPVFSEENYTFKVPMPLMPKSDITVYGDSVTVTHLDFTNTNIVFSIDPADFDITTSNHGNKTYTPSFSANKIISLSGTTIYQLTATDSAPEPKSTTVTLTIEVDEETGLDTPTFSSSLFSYSYTYKDNVPTLVSLGSDISINSNKISNADYELAGDYKDNFKIVFTNESKTFSLEVNTDNSLKLDAISPVILNLVYTTDYTTSTVLVVNVIKILPKFNNDYYSGTYSFDDNTITWQDEISITDASGVTLSGGKASLFNIDSSTYKITPIDSLKTSDFDSNSNIILTVTAQSESGNSEAMVIISTPSSDTGSLKFDKSLYKATYSVSTEDKDTVSLTDDIGFSGITDYTDISIEVEETYQSSIEIKLVSDKFQVNVLSNLEDSILASGGELLISITASQSGVTDKAVGVLVLELPSTVMTFGKNYYTASYTQAESGSDSVHLDELITIDVATSNIQLTFVGYESNFEGACDSSQCTFKVKDNLDSSVLSSNTEILVPVVATYRYISGKTAIMVKLPSYTTTFSFSQLHYSADYIIETTETGTAQVNITDVISFVDLGSSDVAISLSDYSSNFKIAYDSSTKACQITVTENLKSEVLGNNSKLIIDLTASKDGTGDYSRASLILKLPDKISVAFVQAHYTAEYVINGDQNEIVLLDDSGIEITDYANVIITLNSFSEVFSVAYDATQSKTVIKIDNPLNDTVLTNYSELKLSMTITKVAVSYGDAVLTIKLPSLSFANKFYVGTYSVENDAAKIDIDAMSIETADLSLVDVTLSDYTDYFTTTLTDNKLTLTSSKPLTSEITDKNENLPVTLTATRKSDNSVLATTSLVINLPSSASDSKKPEFTKFTFNGTYTVTDNGATVALDSDIIILKKSGITVTSVYIEDATYSGNFELESKEENIYTIKVNSLLSDNTLKTETSLVFTLIAVSSDGVSGYASLVITLPKIAKEQSVKFKDILYTSEYKNGELKLNIDLETDSSDSDINIVLSNENNLASYFTKTYSKNVLVISATNLPESVTSNNAVIALKIVVTDQSTQDEASAVLNVNTGVSNNSNDDSSPTGMNKGLLVAVIILACLLVSLIVTAGVYWYFKNRENYANLEEDVEKIEPKQTKFTKKNDIKKKPDSISSEPLRRPTGIHIIPPTPPIEELDEVQVDGAPKSGSDKVVAFSDDVEKIEDNTSDDFTDNYVNVAERRPTKFVFAKQDAVETNEDDDTDSDNYISVADRRPTKFVFANPLEEGVFDSTDSSAKSPVPNPDEERKKSVAFDDNVERVHIDPIQDESDSDEDSDTAENEKAEEKPDESQLNEMPSDILKQVF
ncbi:uncharacterized protein LOC115881502 isoform X1 [Sitophilus oryzae]|uniref:Uncharacterized protein LOC115881502 isoform X1 n=1 Tax=Sitophilus oryzae TaxID=7048 RepID=A0A6J2XVS9_SITOR|nr:uncharacterized protein LOC115881502 isoform X1 [Sitophilus oryzae]